jgi:hypothetical protein
MATIDSNILKVKYVVFIMNTMELVIEHVQVKLGLKLLIINVHSLLVHIIIIINKMTALIVV